MTFFGNCYLFTTIKGNFNFPQKKKKINKEEEEEREEEFQCKVLFYERDRTVANHNSFKVKLLITMKLPHVFNCRKNILFKVMNHVYQKKKKVMNHD